MPDLAASIDACRAWPDVAVLTLQNGVGAEELVMAARPDAPLLAGSLTAPIERDADGRLAWRKRRGIALAPVRGETAGVAAAVRDALVSGGLPVAVVRDWRAMKWSKLLTNLVANAVPALLDEPAADVYADRRLFGVERSQAREVLAVMRALRLSPLRLPGADVRLLAIGFRAPAAIARPVIRRVGALIVTVASGEGSKAVLEEQLATLGTNLLIVLPGSSTLGGARGGKAPSLLLHLRAGGGPSESPWLNGGVARAGLDAGVATPVNAALAALMEAAAADPAAWARTRGRPDALLAAITHASITQDARRGA